MNGAYSDKNRQVESYVWKYCYYLYEEKILNYCNILGLNWVATYIENLDSEMGLPTTLESLALLYLTVLY